MFAYCNNNPSNTADTEGNMAGGKFCSVIIKECGGRDASVPVVHAGAECSKFAEFYLHITEGKYGIDASENARNILVNIELQGYSTLPPFWIGSAFLGACGIATCFIPGNVGTTIGVAVGVLGLLSTDTEAAPIYEKYSVIISWDCSVQTGIGSPYYEVGNRILSFTYYYDAENGIGGINPVDAVRYDDYTTMVYRG